MTPSDKPTLSDLYRQRRAQHPVPESLSAKLKSSYRQRIGQRFRWRSLAPTLVSAALVIIILRPQMMSDPSDVDAEAPMDTVSMTKAAQEPAVSQADSIAKPAARESARTAEEQEASEALQASPQAFSMAAKSAPAVMADTRSQPIALPENFKEPVFLQIQNPGAVTGLNCQGESTPLPEITGFQTGDWVSVQWIDEQWVIETFPENPCPK